MHLDAHAARPIHAQARVASRRSSALEDARLDQVGLVGVPLEIRTDERTDRDQAEAAPADVVERARDERAPEPVALEVLQDFRVEERNRVLP